MVTRLVRWGKSDASAPPAARQGSDSASAQTARDNLAASQHPQGGQLVSAARVLGAASLRTENKTAFFSYGKSVYKSMPEWEKKKIDTNGARRMPNIWAVLKVRCVMGSLFINASSHWVYGGINTGEKKTSFTWNAGDTPSTLWFLQ